MALPFFNKETKEFQRTSLRNQERISSDLSSIESTIKDIGGQQVDLLSKIEKWMGMSYEMDLEWMQKELEDKIESKRFRDKMASMQRSSMGTAKPSTDDGDSFFDGFSDMLAPLLAGYGLGKGGGKDGDGKDKGKDGKGKGKGGGRGKPKIPRGVRRLIPGAGLAFAVIDAIDIAMATFDDDLRTNIEGQDIGGLAGSAIGATLGATIGSIFPGVGTLIGGAIGATVGNIIGENIGDWIAPNLEREFKKSAFETQQQNDLLGKQLDQLLKLREQGYLSEEQYLIEKQNIEARLASNERLVEERKLANDLLDQRNKAHDDYQRILKEVKESEALGLVVPESLRLALEEARKSYETLDTKFKAEVEELRNFADNAKEKGVLKDSNWWNDFTRSLGFSTDKIDTLDVSNLDKLSESDLRGLESSGNLKYSSLIAVRNEIKKRSGNTNFQNPDDAETIMAAYQEAVMRKDSSGILDIKAYLATFQGGKDIGPNGLWQKLKRGELKNSDLKKLVPKAPSRSVDEYTKYDAFGAPVASDTRMLAGMGDTGEFAEIGGAPTPKPKEAPNAANLRGGFAGTGEFAGSVTSSASIPTVGGLGGIDYKSYAASIAEKESAGDYRAINTLGYVGKYQMGSMALQDAGLVKPGTKQSKKDIMNPANWNLKGGVEAFFNDPALQEKTMAEYTKRNFATLKRIGVLNDNSSVSQIAGYLATSHLLGAGGAKEFMMGKDGADAYGTTGSTYFAVGTGSQGGGSVGPSSSGSVSGGSAGSRVNSGSKLNAAMSSGGSSPVVVNNNNVDNSSVSSVSQTTSMPATANRARSVGTRLDYNDPVLLY